MSEREERHEVVARLCGQLAGRVGLASGEIRITVSGHKAVKIEVVKQVRVCCVQRSGNRWDSPQDAGELLLEEAPPFVTAHLETKIIEMVGGYGCLAASIDRGSVTNLQFNIALRAHRPRRVRERQAYC